KRMLWPVSSMKGKCRFRKILHLAHDGHVLGRLTAFKFLLGVTQYCLSLLGAKPAFSAFFLPCTKKLFGRGAILFGKLAISARMQTFDGHAFEGVANS